MWFTVGGLLLILAIAQYDERRRFLKRQNAYEQKLMELAHARIVYTLQVQEYIAALRAGRPAVKPAAFNPPLPPAPTPPDQLLIRRVRHALCIGAFAVAAAMLIVWLLAAADVARRNRRLIAETMLAMALFGTIGMMPGLSYWRGWNRFDLRADAAGWGMILVPLGVIAVMAARWRDHRTDATPRCTQCDYNLSANVSGVCPECGAVVADAGGGDGSKM
ncbi:MAG: hypothetical protein QOE14_2287 [Humisphaera sp.]|nr:hypothetical protein [Humisphaera sp.]